MAALEHTNLHGEVFYKIVFPEFWERAYREKNAYYKRVTERAKKHEAHLRCCIDPEYDSILSYAEKNGGKIPEGDVLTEKRRLELLWSEECWYFCEEIPLTERGVAYCTKDMDIFLCEECFDMFKKAEEWTVRSADELV